MGSREGVPAGLERGSSLSTGLAGRCCTRGGEVGGAVTVGTTKVKSSCDLDGLLDGGKIGARTVREGVLRGDAKLFGVTAALLGVGR